MQISPFTAMLACLLALGACGEQVPGGEATAENTLVTTNQKSGLYDVASLDVYADGDSLHLLLTGKTAQDAVQTGLRYLRSADAGQTWSEPIPVPAHGARAPFRLQRGNDAQIAAHGENIIAVWAVAGEGWGGVGPFVTAVSDDGGKTWQPGSAPGADGKPASQGFHDLAFGPDGALHAVWLDSRDGEQGLYASHSTDGGKHWSPSTTLDPQTCECCRNTLVVGENGSRHVLYRNIKPRDMALVSNAGASWQRRGPVGAFNWRFKGCPHTGGGLALRGEQMHALVWTGALRSTGPHYLRSLDGGTSWSEPQRMSGETSGHPDLVAGPDNRLLAAWDTRDTQGYAIQIALSKDGGNSWLAPQTLRKSTGLASHPRVSAVVGGFQVFWTEETETGNRNWALRSLR